MKDQSKHFGNASKEGPEHRGWIVGHFMESDDVRHSRDVEIKWGIHPAGDERASWVDEEYRTTVLLLIKGKFHINLDSESYVLENEGDYVMWGQGISHSWRAELDSTVITVRWPSLS